MKKLTSLSNSNDWSRDSSKFVSKSYMEDASREMYFGDVKLQVGAKLWGGEYSRHNPPKNVNIFMMAVIELYERPGSPCSTSSTSSTTLTLASWLTWGRHLMPPVTSHSRGRDINSWWWNSG